jgi:ribosomal protein S19E (S16A)
MDLLLWHSDREWKTRARLYITATACIRLLSRLAHPNGCAALHVELEVAAPKKHRSAVSGVREHNAVEIGGRGNEQSPQTADFAWSVRALAAARQCSADEEGSASRLSQGHADRAAAIAQVHRYRGQQARDTIRSPFVLAALSTHGIIRAILIGARATMEENFITETIAIFCGLIA